MPHSSGGGSHGGGSHGGHSHHSSSRHGRSGNSTRISKTNFVGARRYRYRHHGQERYFYSDRAPDKIFDKKRLWIGLFYIPFPDSCCHYDWRRYCHKHGETFR